MISVVITLFEQAGSLLPLLHCLRAQTLDEKYEIILCDDGSSEWALQEANQHPALRELDIRYIWQSKKGHRASRSKNSGLRCARGNLVVMLDGDILVKPDFLSHHKAAHVNKRQVVCNPRKWILGGDPVISAALGRSRVKHPFIAKITDLARKDSQALFEFLDKHSMEFDRQTQRDFARASSPWMACIGFSFSFSRAANSALFFDERFEGWGPEDREFALRLVVSEGYEISYRDDISVYHLESFSTGRPAFSGFPTEHDEIVLLLKNMIHFHNSYPAQDLSPLTDMIFYFRLDPSSGQWQLGPPREKSDITMEAIEEQLKIVRRWLKTECPDWFAEEYSQTQNAKRRLESERQKDPETASPMAVPS